MFERFETWSFEKPSPKDLYDTAWRTFSSAGFALYSASSYGFQGKSVSPKWGLHRLVEVTVLPWKEGGTVQVKFRAAPTDEGLAVGVVGAILIWPAALVGGVISWDKYENDWRDTRTLLWNSLVQTSGGPPISTFIPPSPPLPNPTSSQTTGPPPQPLPACPSCGSSLPAGSKFCNLCGTHVRG